MLTKLMAAVFGLVLVTGTIAPSNAAITLVNESSLNSLGVPQDGSNITRDLTNKLDFLDWTLTVNRSVNGVKANLLGPGQLLAGWRFATRTDLRGLAASAGLHPDCYAAVYNLCFDQGRPAPISPAFDALFTAMGTVQDEGVDEEGNGGRTTNFNFFLNGDLVQGNMDQFYFSGDVGMFFNLVALNFPSADLSNPFIGNALVRQSPVPIPAALPLFITALAGLGIMARRRAKGR